MFNSLYAVKTEGSDEGDQEEFNYEITSVSWDDGNEDEDEDEGGYDDDEDEDGDDA
jgi:hypothetical protein